MTQPANRVDASSVGKYMQLTQNCAAHETMMGDWILVSMHITGGSAGNHKTDFTTTLHMLYTHVYTHEDCVYTL